MRKPPWRYLWFVASISLSACDHDADTNTVTRADATSPASVVDTLVIVAIDGVRWQEIFGGVDRELANISGLSPDEIVGADQLLPNIQRLVLRGGTLRGGPEDPMFTANRIRVSLPGYFEIFTGSVSCTSNSCARTQTATFIDEVANRSERAAVIASWPMIAYAASTGKASAVISCGRHQGENLDELRYDEVADDLLAAGDRADPTPGGGDYRADLFTAAIALRYLSARSPRVLFVGLGDTDEYAHHKDYRGYLNALRFADGIVGQIAWNLEQRGAPHALLVTTDHGRSNSFHDHGRKYAESGRVWALFAGSGDTSYGFRATYLRDLPVLARELLGLAESTRAQGRSQ